jgi:ferredoxin
MSGARSPGRSPEIGGSVQRSLKVHVDPDICVGNGMCREEAPGTFDREADGRSTAVANPTDDAEAILEAAAVCPVGAITVHDAESGECLYP